jgi:flagellar motor switch protein FliM
MAETLTQAEIDALREAVRSGKIEDVAKEQVHTPAPREYKVVGYDFRKPQLLSAEHLVMLQTMHQSLAKNIQGLLFSMFKITADLTLAAMDQVSYGEFMLSLETPTYLLGISMQPDFGPVGFEVSSTLGSQILEMLLGGEGNIEAEDAPSREFTILEMEIIRTWADRVLDEVQLAWDTVQPLQMSVISTGVSPDQIQVVPGDTPCICAGIDVNIHNQRGRIHICYPFSTLQTIFQKSTSDQDLDRKAELRKTTLRALQQVPIETSVELGKASIRARQLQNLQVGDIIKLDNRATDALRFYLGDARIGTGVLGSRHGRLAVRLETMVSTPKASAPPTGTPPQPKPPTPPAQGKTPAMK